MKLCMNAFHAVLQFTIVFSASSYCYDFVALHPKQLEISDVGADYSVGCEKLVKNLPYNQIHLGEDCSPNDFWSFAASHSPIDF